VRAGSVSDCERFTWILLTYYGPSRGNSPVV